MAISDLKQLPLPEGPPYKDVLGRYLTLSLFVDMASTRPQSELLYRPIFTLYEDKPGFINARKTFLALKDPTGYTWAQKYLGDWNAFLRLLKAEWFRDAFEVWSNELEKLLQDEAIQIIQGIAKDTEQASPVRLQAAKYIANREWDKRGRGRPSSEDVKGELRRAVDKISAEQEDLDRITGFQPKVIQGGK
jgi:hypothetical protein